MGAKSKIEWTDSTWTPIRAKARASGKVGWYCTHASEGCRFCYAERLNLRLGTGLPFKPGYLESVEIFLDENMLFAPLRWKKPRNIFVCSTTDLFASFVPDEFIDRMFAVMALTPQHTYQILTKRPDRMRAYHTSRRLTQWMHAATSMGRAAALVGREGFPLKHVWLGTSIEDQPNADARIPELLQTPAAVRFISAEPLLGPVDIRRWVIPKMNACQFTGTDRESVAALYAVARAAGRALGAAYIDWVIAGGESGPGARPSHPDWFRSLRDQCAEAGVPYHFKQWGEWHPSGSGTSLAPDGSSPGPDRWNDPSTAWMRRVGKKKAGRLLDGREHNELPSAA